MVTALGFVAACDGEGAKPGESRPKPYSPIQLVVARSVAGDEQIVVVDPGSRAETPLSTGGRARLCRGDIFRNSPPRGYRPLSGSGNTPLLASASLNLDCQFSECGSQSSALALLLKISASTKRRSSIDLFTSWKLRRE